MVGKHLMPNGYVSVMGAFEHPTNEYRSIQSTRVVMDWYDSDPAHGFYGGGAIDARMIFGPALFALEGMPPGVPRWGAGYKQALRELFTRTVEFAGHTTSLPLERNSISLDPQRRDSFGRPGIRVTYRDHDDDLSMLRFLQDRGVELMEAAGARRTWTWPVQPSTIVVHLLGTARMGNDPRSSVVDRYHRAHDVPNLFICDGSSFVTSGRGQPTMTIQALAFRAADHITRFAQRGEV
jgi:choline dehydrogenase-like flavoprotein